METVIKIFSESSIWRSIILILVLLGTNPYSFSRLAKAADTYAENSKENVFIQLGHTKYLPLRASYKDFLSKQDVINKISEAEIVITQGGFGSIADCLRAGKKVVAVPRKPELREATDQQEELVRELEKLGRLVGVYDIDKLPDAILKARISRFKGGEKQSIADLIKNYLLFR